MRVSKSTMPKSKHDIRFIYSHFNGNVPFIDKEPLLEHYGLTEDWDTLLEEETRRTNLQSNSIFWSGYIVVWIITALSISTESSDWVSLLLLSIIVFLSYSLFLILTGINVMVDRCLKTPVKTKVDQFKNDKKAYLYWRYQKQTEFWNNLNGYEFEQYVGLVFTKNKYKVHQTKLSGDGGVDLIIEKNNEKTAVQCKAHKKAVGPSVVRDLYGTMNHFGYKKGALVSINGFTSGVYTFVKDKDIELISVQELIEMCGD